LGRAGLAAVRGARGDRQLHRAGPLDGRRRPRRQPGGLRGGHSRPSGSAGVVRDPAAGRARARQVLRDPRRRRARGADPRADRRARRRRLRGLHLERVRGLALEHRGRRLRHGRAPAGAVPERARAACGAVMSGEPSVREQDILRRCGLSEIATPSWTPAEDVAAYAARGFAAIGIWLHKLERGSIDGFWIPEATIAPEVVEATAASVRGAGLTVSHLVLTGFYTEPELADRID